MLSRVRSDLNTSYPNELVDALLHSYEEITKNYFLDNYEPSELNSGKFCEAVYRILEFETKNGSYTALGTPIPNMVNGLRQFEQVPKTQSNVSYRIHIPRVLLGIYNIRNQRGVGHLSGDINPNFTDSTLLISNANWVLSELFRIHYQCPLEEAQKIVDLIASKPLPLVAELGEIKRVLLHTLIYSHQVLVLLSTEHPNPVDEENLIKWIEPKDKSDFRNRVLSELHNKRYIEYKKNGLCNLLPPGLKFVEENIRSWSKKLN